MKAIIEKNGNKVEVELEKITDLVGAIFTNPELSELKDIATNANNAKIYVSKQIPKVKLKELVTLSGQFNMAVYPELEEDWISKSAAGYKTIAKRISLGLMSEEKREAWEEYCNIIDIGLLFKEKMTEFLKNNGINLVPGIYLKTKKETETK